MSASTDSTFPVYSYAYGGPVATGKIKAIPEDFFVDEQLDFEPSGEGEHVFLHIEKRCLTTLAVRDKIAKLAACKSMDVGYSGLKDKWAVTRQWFSVYLPGGDQLDWQSLCEQDDSDNGSGAYIKLLTVCRHSRKLRRGTHKANAFKLVVSSLDASSLTRCDVAFKDQLAQKIKALCEQGVPNYFGEQRFGRNNLAKARALFSANKRMPREQRSLCLSAARSYLFNQVLDARIAADNWSAYLDGDVLMLDGSRSRFVLDDNSVDKEQVAADIDQRLAQGDIHISGPMCGRGSSGVTSLAEQFEDLAIADELALMEGLDRQGVDVARRPLRFFPKQLDWHLDSEKCHLSFVLPTGSYATVLIRELVECL
ncbi:MAG: tRNA pseudouridine(13) synthase TruD [Pseudomonadales bacterium]|nr:tRNA pseudouridine(13) synthase TruD [Pseudomonadales bacterium]